jgi:uroporphyrin-III C-methyltransferase
MLSRPNVDNDVAATRPQPGHVYLVGAGPGDPGLLTVRAAALLATCEVILPDDLVSAEILALANPQAIVIPVGKRCGQPRITQAGIHALMIEHARPANHLPPRSVLRLKSGDPLVFGRAREEIEALGAAQIPFEIVPGITTAFAVAASLRTPLTDRESSSRLVLATAHHAQGKPPAAALDPDVSISQATLAIYMPGRDFAALSSTLLEDGLRPETPVIAVSRASTPHDRVTRTTIAGLASVEPGPAPVLVLVGESLRLGPNA